MKKELSRNVVEVTRKNDRDMAIVLTLGKKVIRTICSHRLPSGRPDPDKVCFYDEMASKWDLGNSREIIIIKGDFNGCVEKC